MALSDRSKHSIRHSRRLHGRHRKTWSTRNAKTRQQHRALVVECFSHRASKLKERTPSLYMQQTSSLFHAPGHPAPPSLSSCLPLECAVLLSALVLSNVDPWYRSSSSEPSIITRCLIVFTPFSVSHREQINKPSLSLDNTQHCSHFFPDLFKHVKKQNPTKDTS